LHLAREHGLSTVVLEAGPIGWGASGRNGGFCGLGGTKRAYPELARRFGIAEARRLFDLQRAGPILVRGVAAEEGIELEIAGEGEHVVAHRASRWHVLENEAGMMARLFGERWRLWRRPEMEERLLRSPEAHGCLVVPHGFGLHPLRLVRGLAAAAARRGARVCARTPVTAWRVDGGRHRLATPGGTVTAGRVLVATNGYTPEGLHPSLAGRTLPVLLSILVTRPLTPGELAAHGWTSPALVADTRRLLSYTRLLPDRRLLFGARGGLDASPAAMVARRAWLERRLRAWFPAWRDVAVEHAWWGLACLARDLLPHLGWSDERRTVLTALAYHGSGVALATAFGRAAAAQLAGRSPDPPLPGFLQGPPPRFPVPGLRLAGLRAAYAGYGLRDALP
jgi:glycine/D-amino acid oxidase-like deaminating enzyme